MTTSLLLGGASAQEARLPRFEDYPATEKFRGRPARAKISRPRARLFQTKIRTQAREGPNFAGSYTLAWWGCGTGCRGYAVIDTRTGKVHFNPKALSVVTVLYQDEDQLQFRPDSRLLIVSGLVDGVGGYESEGKFYYEWRGDRFRLIRKTAIKKYGPGRD